MPTNLEKAIALAKQRDFGEESLRLNRELVAANPADVGSRNRLASCLRLAGQLDDAEAEYAEVLRREGGNRIARNGLEAIARQRRLDGMTPDELLREPPPDRFVGFRRREFIELEFCPDADTIHRRFSPCVLELLARLNALPCCREIAAALPAGRTSLFRLGLNDVHAQHPGHWYVFNLGGRWEPQVNIGMFSGRNFRGDWLRIGIGFNLTLRGWDSDAARKLPEVRARFSRFQNLLRTEPMHTWFVDWMTHENGLIQIDAGGPRTATASEAAETLQDLRPERTEWVFFGKWLAADREVDARVLSEPVMLVRVIESVFSGLLPLWRAIRT